MSRTDPSTIEGYLDALFDRLAGTGAAGRRGLAETEDHLRTATTEAMDRGVDRDEAERAAVAQFGDVPTFALALRRAHRPGPLAAVLSSGWLLAGLGVAAAAVAFLATSLDRVLERALHPDAFGACLTEGSVPCGTEGQSLLIQALVAAVLAAALLAARSVARRRTGLVASSRALPYVAAAVSAVLAPVFLMAPPLLSPEGDPTTFNARLVGDTGPGFLFSAFAAYTAAACVLAAVVWAVIRHRRTPAR